MSEDLSYICTVIRKIINIVLIILGVYFGIKLAIFYMPFLIAFVISLIIEPAIRFFMNKTMIDYMKETPEVALKCIDNRKELTKSRVRNIM